MEKHQHFSHQHPLTFHKSLEAAQLTCSGCKFPCTGTPIYSCRPCKFYLHDQCFDAKRWMNHWLHPKHPVSLFQSPTYSSGSFVCNLCNETGSGFCFSCTVCEFDLHVNCAYEKVQVKAHPNHPLSYLTKPPYSGGLCVCDVCGSGCDSNGPVYHCDVCGYDAHVECVKLPETVERGDHPHVLSLLHVNPYRSFECDVCRESIARNHCMYLCKSGCNYGMHVKCVAAKVKVRDRLAEMSDREFQVEMLARQTQLYHDKVRRENLLLLTSSDYRPIWL